MYQAATIGKNFDTTARLIDDPVSEWYVPPFAPTMNLVTAQSNYNRLIDQVSMWADKLMNANNKEVANINKIIEVQQRKIDDYEKKIAAMQPTGPQDQNQDNDGGMINDPNRPPASKNKTLLYAGVALLAIVVLKRFL